MIARKEWNSLLLEKTLILAMIIQLLIASFSSLLVIGLASFFDPSALNRYDMEKGKIGVIGDGGELRQFLRESHIMPRYYQDLDSALSDFNNNRIDAVLVVPPAASSGSEIIQLELYLPVSDIRGTLATLQLKKPLEAFESYVRDVRAPRIGFEPVRLYVDEELKKTSTYFEFIYGILIPLLVFTPIFISGGLIIDMVTEEYERRTMELLEVAPMSFSQIMNGKMLVAVLIVPMQALLWLALVGINRIAVHNIPGILLVATVTAVVIVILGAIIAVKYRDRTISQYLYSLILIFLFLGAYLFADSPFNLVTRLSSGAAGGVEALIGILPYVAVAVPLYVYAGRLRE
ncbi:MAG: ABC transporter permease [Euryarchaeota archaeon]|nr:ABC transporter permease [Euryarchaeota archaeon]MBU4340538.1 ABC transporter permease [Euryarchaeota archaeon]MBU4454687.1 ABC transporter permease [Euryarchaeota archaeon]MCG2737256.1 ABC transporter permease [Candidatus Methanoperedenaceae archaeon]